MYCIREVYLNEHGVIKDWTQRAQTDLFESAEQLEQELHWMLEACHGEPIDLDQLRQKILEENSNAAPFHFMYDPLGETGDNLPSGNYMHNLGIEQTETVSLEGVSETESENGFGVVEEEG